MAISRLLPRNKRNFMTLNAEQALGHFEERLEALDDKKVVAEAKRCMSCGLCFECDNCVVYCPQIAVFKVKKTQVHYWPLCGYRLHQVHRLPYLRRCVPDRLH